MKGHWLLGLSLVASSLALAGCQTGSADLAAVAPDLPALLAEGPDGPSLTRAQKPDTTRKSDNLLNIRPDEVSPGSQRAARIRAVVNGEAILDEEVVAAAFQHLVGVRTEAEKAEILNRQLNELIDREVILQDAFAKLARAGGGKFLEQLKAAASKEFNKQWLEKTMRGNKFTDEKEFRKFLKANGVPLDMIRRQWERNFIMMEYVRHRIDPYVQKVGHLQIVQYYQEHPEEFRVEDSVEWQDLFIAAARHPTREAARTFAEVLRSRLARGEDFVRLAREYDNGDSCLRDNAAGIGSKRGEIKPVQAEGVLFGLKDGEVGPVIEIETGYHVVRLVKRTHAGRVPFDEKVQKEIHNKLRNEVFQKEMKKIVADLKRKAIIEVAQDVN